MPLTADDRLAIMETVARYNQAIDDFLPDAADAWADCFIARGTFRGVTRSGAKAADRFPDDMLRAAKPADSLRTDPESLISLTGREQLRAFAAAAHRARAMSPRPGYHWVANILIDGDGDGDRASMTCYLRVGAGKTSEHAEGATSTGFYRDRLCKVDGHWKFESRFVTFDD